MNIKEINKLTPDTITEEKIQGLASSIIQDATLNNEQEGTYVLLTALKKSIDAAMKGLKDSVSTKINDKDDQFPANVKVSLSERKAYEYKDDHEWLELDNQINTIKTHQKNRENLLKAGMEQRIVNPFKKPIDPTTGEELPFLDYKVSQIITVKFDK